MLPLNQTEINEYKRAFQEFDNRLDDDNVLITMEQMPKLLCELSKTHSETDAKTLFNELEIAADGTGWILDLPTFMVLMLHKGSQRTHNNNQNNKSNKKPKKTKIFTKQWKYLIEHGELISTEIDIPPIAEDSNANIDQNQRYQSKSFIESSNKCISYPNYQSEYGIEFPIYKCKHKDNDTVDENNPQSKVAFQDLPNMQTEFDQNRDNERTTNEKNKGQSCLICWS